MAAQGGSNTSSEQYAWGDDGQDDEEREPEAFIVDKKAVARAGLWVEAHYLLPPCDPVVEGPANEHPKKGNFTNVAQKREIADPMEALEIENCELAGRMASLEGLLREREEETQALRRQLLAYTQVGEPGYGETMSGITVTEWCSEMCGTQHFCILKCEG